MSWVYTDERGPASWMGGILWVTCSWQAGVPGYVRYLRAEFGSVASSDGERTRERQDPDHTEGVAGRS